MLLNDLQTKLNASLKSGDTMVVETLRYLIAAVQNAATAKYGREAEAKLTDADILDVVKKQVKTHKESIEAFAKAGRVELEEKEKAQLAILESYLPKELTDEELKVLLAPVAASGGDLPAGEAGFGPLMGKAMAKVAGKAGGDRVAKVLRELTAKPK